MEPVSKRLKLEEQLPAIKIKAVLPDEVEAISLMWVFTSKVQKKQQIFIAMQELTQLLPANNCQHLKRVQGNEIILCRVDELLEQNLKQLLVGCRLPKEIIESLCENIQKKQVPATVPKLRCQFERMQQYWPCKFHADKYIESLYNGTIFSDKETTFHCDILTLLLDMSSNLEAKKPFGICVDPRTNSIVALAASQVESNPLMHCPMVLIDFVARTQNAGTWNERWKEEFMSDHKGCGSCTMAGITKRHYDFVQQHSTLQRLTFGAEHLRLKGLPPEDGDDNLSKYGPYLCTGYDVYLSDEPCLMCAMALVHSRARRVFFARRTQRNGALASCFKLHAVKELNHHYEVFQCHIGNQDNEEIS